MLIEEEQLQGSPAPVGRPDKAEKMRGLEDCNLKGLLKVSKKMLEEVSCFVRSPAISLDWHW